MIASLHSRGPQRAESRGRPPAALPAALLAAALLALLPAAPPAAAQSGGERTGEAAGSPLPRDTARIEVAGLRLGSWQLAGPERDPDASYSAIPVMDAFYQLGLGRRSAVQLGLGLWRRGRVSGAGTLAMWVAPFYAGLKHYPLGGPGQAVAPYVAAAAGPALGYEQRRSSGFGDMESGWTAAVGAGADVAAGVEVGLGPYVGLSAGVQYQWVEYLAGELDGPDAYRGAVLEAGVTYRVDLP